MRKIVLKYSTDDGIETIRLENERTSFGRGGEADYRFDDDGLSRLHATIYKEDERVWVVDEGSTNGTFVNGEKVPSAGTPISDGDTVKIGHFTNLEVCMEEAHIYESAASVPSESQDEPNFLSASSETAEPSMVVPLLVTAFALLVITGAAVFIGVSVIKGNRTQIAQNQDTFDDDLDDEEIVDDDEENTNISGNTLPDDSTTPLATPTPTPIPNTSDNTNVTDSPIANNREISTTLPSGKTYQQMSQSEQNQYIKIKAEKVARIIGNRSGESIPPEAISSIKRFLNGYKSKLRAPRRNDCTTGGWRKSDMVSILERARTNAPFIIRAFNQKGIDPQVGLYLAMIESEHCPCLQSPTGPLGMFQFTRATARRYGLDARRGASPSNPDERCQPQAAAGAAASYMKSLTGRIGTGPLSIPLAIASYNSGEGGLGKNLKTALEANESQERSFWTLVANAEKLAVQFQKENIKYVPKFFAAAIIGENPRDFGVNMQPLSTYTR